jgi:hypothetical protein
MEPLVKELTRLARYRATLDKLASIEPTAPDAGSRVMRAVAGLNNREAHAAITQWMKQNQRSLRGFWRDIYAALWAERKRLKAEARRPQGTAEPRTILKHDVNTTNPER